MMLAASILSLALLLVPSEAFPTQPGSCDSPQPFGDAHLRGGAFVGGTALSTVGLELVIAGKVAAPGILTSITANKASTVELRGATFRGYLLKISKPGVDTTAFFTSSDATVRDDLQSCLDLNSGSLSHTNRNDKTSITGTFQAPKQAATGFTLEVTVAIQNGDVSEWYQSVYPISIVAPIVICFPGDAVATVKDRGSVAMKDLNLGDLVLTDTNNSYEPIYSFGHYDAEASAEFLQLKTASSKTVLELSEDHMVFAKDNNSYNSKARAVPASSIQVGDALVLASGDLEAVESIATVVREGVVAPFTPSGTIVVNGVKASSFVAFQGSETLVIGDAMSAGITYQWLAHTFELPHRVWCYHLGACKEERHVDGVSTWVNVPHKMVLWFVNQGTFVMAALSLPCLLIMACLWMLGLVIASPFTVLVGTAISACFFSVRIQAKKTI